MKTLIAIDGTELQVSDCDHLFLSAYNWQANGRGYYVCSNRCIWNGQQVKGKLLHWFIAQRMKLVIPEDYQIDHTDRNKLNNQRSNLRVASVRLQRYNRDILKTNTSGYTGVNFQKDCINNPWAANIMMPDGKQRNLGYFKTAEEASKKYQAKKKERDEKEIQRCKAL